MPSPGIIISLVVPIVVVLVLVLRAARDNKLGQFRFKLSATLLKIITFGIEIESQREPDRLPPGEPGP